MNHPDLSRRSWIAGSLTGLMAAGLPEWFAKSVVASEAEETTLRSKRYGPNDQIQIGLIGAGGSRGGFRQGLGDAKSMSHKPGCKVIAVCDVDGLHREEAAREFGPDTAKYKDFRELVDRKDIDAVVIGTPDHWHTIIAVAAMKSGKDVYCEKPLTLFIDEGKKIVKTQRKTERIFQVGSQQRSDARFRLACELVRNGRIGRIKQVITHLPTGEIGGPFPVKSAPADFDWDMWLGPAHWADYVPQRTHGSFRHWLEYSGGMMTDWGAHHNDIAQWGLGMDRSGPISVEAMGKPHPMVGSRCFNAFVEFDITYMYPDGISMLCTNKGENGVDFIGENGSIFVNRETIRASDKKLLDEPLPDNATRLYVSNDHIGNFVDCVRSRKPAICDAETGHRSVTVCHLGNMSLRLNGRKLEWDPEKEQFKDDPEADSMLSRPLRSPWRL